MSTTDEHPERPGRPERATSQPHAVVGVGLVVVGPDGRVLLGQAHDGRWELPGGKVDAGEGFEQAAARELVEETALRVDPEAIRILSVQIDAEAGLTRLTAAAVTTTADGVPAVTEPDKIARWQWFDPADIPTALYEPSVGVLRVWRPDLTTLPHLPTYDYPTATATNAPAPPTATP